jgi:4-amino-4-deoxy-L-arabinose transferase-like glycosyltransferase
MKDSSAFLLAIVLFTLAVWFAGGLIVFILYWMSAPDANGSALLSAAGVCFVFPAFVLLSFIGSKNARPWDSP